MHGMEIINNNTRYRKELEEATLVVEIGKTNKEKRIEKHEEDTRYMYSCKEDR